MKKKKLDNVLLNIYRDLYKYSDPSVDFDMLVESAECDDKGRKIIPYDNYTIDGEVMDKIINMHIISNRLKGDDRKLVRVHAYLGCSPIVKIYE